MMRIDLGNRLQPTADPGLRPALPSQDLAEKLSGLVVGQRLLAEVEALLPNGTYRAMVNQRAVTLALPFAAKSGDVIELEVAESDGKLTLAVVRAGARSDAAGAEAAATQLSRTGQLIASLLTDARDARAGSAALPLNGNRPIAAQPPASGRELQPLLQQAIVASGMFYESHQAEWVEGRFGKAQLLQEPQGKLPPQVSSGGQSGPTAASRADVSGPTIVSTPAQLASRESTVSPPLPSPPEGRGPLSANPGDGALPARLPPDAAPVVPASGSRQDAPTTPSTAHTPAADPVAPQAQALVQQQLEAFATQNFVWQGQVWPGQQMEWQIEDPGQHRRQADDAGDESWQTRLRLTLPALGEIEARLQIHGQQLVLTLTADGAGTRALLHDGGATLRTQLAEVGLDLTSFAIAQRVSTPHEVVTNDSDQNER